MTQRKQTRPDSDQPMLTHYKFQLELKITDPAEIATKELQDRVLDAIQDYDARGRLLTGPQMPGGISCLVGLSLKLEDMEREPDRSAQLLDTQKLKDKYPFWRASQPEYKEVVGISVAIDDEIERLREVQGKRLATAAGFFLDGKERDYAAARACCWVCQFQGRSSSMRVIG